MVNGALTTEEHLAARLQELFKPLRIGNLSRSDGNGKTTVSAEIAGSIPAIHIHMAHEQTGKDLPEQMPWKIQFSSRNKNKIMAEVLPDDAAVNAFVPSSVYIPTKEIISFFQGFREVARKYSLQFDATYLDLADSLALPELKDRPQLLYNQIQGLSETIGGTVVLKNGQFFLKSSNKKEQEINLAAEGLRKIATLLHLINNGSLEQGGTLFWDEPESNLNPRLVKLVARTLYSLAAEGVQVILATHSLFLLREFEILGHQREFKETGRCFFSMDKTEDGVIAQQSDILEEIDPIVMLDESLLQSDRYLEEV